MFEIQEILEVCKGKLFCGEFSGKVKGISIDSRTIKKGDLFIAIKGATYDGHDFINQAVKKGACVILVSKKVKTKRKNIVLISVKDTVSSLADLARYWREKLNPVVIAVTGTNGKTTTKDLIYAVLKQQIPSIKSELTQNNHIGVPLNLLKIKAKHRVAVVELGTNHPKEIAYLSSITKPDIAIVTNIGPAHLENFHTLKEVLKEKFSLFRHAKENSICIVNSDDLLISKTLGTKPFFGKSIIFTFSKNRKSDFKVSHIQRKNNGLSFKVGKNKLFLDTPAEHNIYNALIAIACGRILGIDYNKIRKALKGFIFPRGRFNILKAGKVRLIDDTYNANPVSVENALDVFSNMSCQGKRVFVFADMLELGSKEQFFHSLIGKKIAQLPIDILVCIGKRAKISALAALNEGIDKSRVFICNNHKKAIKVINRLICPRDLILLKGSRKMRLEQLVKYIKKP
ncbi:MAG: UDP-N-acetylmuramoyl-tripeptide--D-alanyl-D-alanine ligase [Candidatus Gygaella obscura]|nr:UDP-N-acetylmuramoyl-tripeptide--D-alanyl-D-alanine ligase [Candidatus Gygaella obscura]